MNPDFLWLADAIQLLTIFIIGPVLAIAISYRAWRGKPQSVTPERYAVVWVASGVTSVLAFVFAKWINADVRTPQYFLQLACVLLFGLLFGVFMGSGFAVMLAAWRWHKSTRLSQNNQTR